MKTFFIISLLLGVLELHHTKSRSQQQQQLREPSLCSVFHLFFPHLFSWYKACELASQAKRTVLTSTIVHHRQRKAKWPEYVAFGKRLPFRQAKRNIYIGPLRSSRMQYYSAQISIFNYIGLLNLLGNFLEWSFLPWRITLFIFLQWVMFPRIVLQ